MVEDEIQAYLASLANEDLDATERSKIREKIKMMRELSENSNATDL